MTFHPEILDVLGQVWKFLFCACSSADPRGLVTKVNFPDLTPASGAEIPGSAWKGQEVLCAAPWTPNPGEISLQPPAIEKRLHRAQSSQAGLFNSNWTHNVLFWEKRGKRSTA
jgi:hypothetical protein